MINDFSEHRQLFQERLTNISADYHYKFTRYQAHYSIVLAYITEDTDLGASAKHIRESDILIFFKPNLCAIIFDNTDEEQGIKAANNVLSRIQGLFFSKHLYMAVVTSHHDKSQFQMIHDLFDLISYALTNHMDNLVVDSSQVIQHQQSV